MKLKTGGGVYETADGKSWRLVYYDHVGRQREKRLRKADCPSKKLAREVRAKLAERAVEEQLGVALPGDRMTLAEYFDGPFSASAEKELAESSWMKHVDRFNNHLRRALGSRKLTEIEHEAVTAAFRGLRRRDGEKGPLAPMTLRGVDKTLSRIMHAAAEGGMLGPKARSEQLAGQWKKPWKSPSPPKAADLARYRLSHEEMRAVLEAASEESPVMAAALLLQVCAGLRRGELSTLRFRDHVRERPGEWDFVVRSGKTGKVKTKVLLGAPAEAFARYVEWHAETFGAECDVVFPIALGRREVRKLGRRREVIRREAGDAREGYVVSDGVWARCKARAGLPASFRLHDLRGSYALAVADAYGVRAAQKALDHASVTTTETHYTNAARSEDEVRAASVFAGLTFGGAQ